MPLEILIRETFGYKFDLAELKEFVRQAEEHCLNEVTWTGYSGDQRDPAQLTLTAKGSV